MKGFCGKRRHLLDPSLVMAFKSKKLVAIPEVGPGRRDVMAEVECLLAGATTPTTALGISAVCIKDHPIQLF